MRKSILLSLAFFLFACTTKRDDEMLYMHNFPVPKTLSFDLTSQTLLQPSLFDFDISDTLTLYKLDLAQTIEMVNITDKTMDEWSKRMNGSILSDTLHFDYKTLPSYYENEHFFICGKLDLHPNITSIVLYNVIDFTSGLGRIPYLDLLWLLNIKENKLCSVVRLDDYTDYSIITRGDIKNNIFTYIREIASRFEDCDYKFFRKLDCAIHGGIDCFAKKHYTRFLVNEEGYIEFVR